MESITTLVDAGGILGLAALMAVFVILWNREVTKREELFLERQQAQAEANEEKSKEQAEEYAAKSKVQAEVYAAELKRLSEENAKRYEALATDLSKKYEVALATVLEVVKANTAAMQQTATINDVLREIRKFAGELPAELNNKIPNSAEGC